MSYYTQYSNGVRRLQQGDAKLVRAFVVALLSRPAGLPENAPLSSYRQGRPERVRGCCQALRAWGEIYTESGRKSEEYALHLLRIGISPMLAAEDNVSKRVAPQQGGWKSDA